MKRKVIHHISHMFFHSLINHFHCFSQMLLSLNVNIIVVRKGDPSDGGELVIGGWNEKLFDSSAIDYIPITDYQWQFTIDS